MNKTHKKNIIGIAYFNGTNGANSANGATEPVRGTIHFYENIKENNVLIDINLSGFKKNMTHGIHIHEAGDLSDNCTSACAHFNPYNTKHGGINSKERHVGDLGNIKSDSNGNVIMKITDKLIKLRGSKCNIIGRSVVIHNDRDDEGLGGFEDSLTTGHSGKRMACTVIGYSKMNFTK
jgi:Cu-Zn family superoxide dismutase